MIPLPLNKWEKSLRPVIDAMDARPLEIHGLLARHPQLLEARWPLSISWNGNARSARTCWGVELDEHVARRSPDTVTRERPDRD